MGGIIGDAADRANGTVNKDLGTSGGTITQPSFNAQAANDFYGHVSGRTAKENKESEEQGNIQNQYNETSGVLQGMQQANSKYVGDMNAAYGHYMTDRQNTMLGWQGQTKGLMDQASKQATDAKSAYDNSILPQQKNNMEAGMSLKQAMDPNNAVQTGYRNMFNQQAQGVQNQGMADYGVMAALGSQATANTMGNGMPMTGGQMQAIQGANMGQAGQAFANAQSYANSLRQQGVMTGIDQSNWAYGQGQNAQQAYQAGIANNVGIQQGFRNEIGGYQNAMAGRTLGAAQQDYNFGAGMAGAQQGFATQQGNQQIANIGQKYGSQNAVIGGQIAQQGAQNAAGIQAGGTIIGAMVGGGAGAAAGGAIAKGATAGDGEPATSSAPGYNTPGEGGASPSTMGYASQPYNNDPYAAPNGQGPVAGGGAGLVDGGVASGMQGGGQSYSQGAYGGGYGPLASSRRY